MYIGLGILVVVLVIVGFVFLRASGVGNYPDSRAVRTPPIRRSGAPWIPSLCPFGSPDHRRTRRLKVNRHRIHRGAGIPGMVQVGRTSLGGMQVQFGPTYHVDPPAIASCSQAG
jgi:hypothetical protein